MTLRKWAAIPPLLYLFLAGFLLVMHLYSVRFNAGDSGESAVPLYLMALPWIMRVPESLIRSPVWLWMAYPALGICFVLNAVLVYAMSFGFLRAGQWVCRRVRGGNG